MSPTDNSDSDEEKSIDLSTTNETTTHQEVRTDNRVTRSGRQTSALSYLNEYDLSNKH